MPAPAATMSIDIDVHRLRAGDVVVVKHPAGGDWSHMRDFARWVKKVAPGVHVVVINDLTSLEVLSVDELAGLGLQRIEGDG